MITPLLALAFGIDIRYAVGATLVSVIATSSGGTAAYVREGYSIIRIGMFLEIAATLGAVVGASLALRMPTNAIAVVLSMVLLCSAYVSSQADREYAKRRAKSEVDPTSDISEERLGKI